MIKILTLNIGAPSAERATRQLQWLQERDEDVFVLTETRATEGSQRIASAFRHAGYAVAFPVPECMERGTLVASRLRDSAPWSGIRVPYIPERVAVVQIRGQCTLTVTGVYVPSRDSSPEKSTKKRRFIDGMVKSLTLCRGAGASVILGDFNVLERDHSPRYPFFEEWEYAFYEAFRESGYADAYRLLNEKTVAHSWVGRTGDGYRYDHVMVSQDLVAVSRRCDYLHETRRHGMTDHSGMVLELDLPAIRSETRRLQLREQMEMF